MQSHRYTESDRHLFTSIGDLDDIKRQQLVPVGLRNCSKTSCWLNSIFQVCVWNDQFVAQIMNNLPPKHVLRDTIQRYIYTLYHHQQNLASLTTAKPFVGQGYPLFVNALLNMDVLRKYIGEGWDIFEPYGRSLQQDAEEGYKAIINKLGDKDSNGQKINWRFTVPGRIIRFLERKSVVVDPKLQASTTTVVNEMVQDGIRYTYVFKPEETAVIILKLSPSMFLNGTGKDQPHMQSLLAKWNDQNITDHEQYTIRALDPNTRQAIEYNVIGERWEVLIDPDFKSLPPFLVFQYGRFVYDARTNSKAKISNPVLTPLAINVSPLYTDAQTQKAKFSRRDFDYEVFGFIQHLGSSIESGHYVAFVNISPVGTRTCDQKWFHISDEDIEPQTLDQIKEAIQHSYLLFYRLRFPKAV